MIDKRSELAKIIGYSFQNQDLLESALCHRSAAAENNERLEYLGDAIINLVVASALFTRFAEAREGELSRLRASLVKRETLAELAQEFNLGNYLRLGAGEQRGGGNQRLSILADALEAVAGAIYLDGGFIACEQCILGWFDKRLNSITVSNLKKDAKTELQEYLQSYRLPLPSYSIKSIMGADHEQQFLVRCAVPGIDQTTEGLGSNRRNAEQQAAQALVDYLRTSKIIGKQK